MQHRGVQTGATTVAVVRWCPLLQRACGVRHVNHDPVVRVASVQNPENHWSWNCATSLQQWTAGLGTLTSITTGVPCQLTFFQVPMLLSSCATLPHWSVGLLVAWHGHNQLLPCPGTTVSVARPHARSTVLQVADAGEHFHRATPPHTTAPALLSGESVKSGSKDCCTPPPATCPSSSWPRTA